MACINMIVLVASFTMACALVVDRNNAAMRPDVVAKTLQKMENTWASQAYVFTGCATTGADFNCKEAPKAFAASCVEVASTLFKVATKESFFEYMNDVCTKMQLGWHQATCQKVGTLVDAEMSASAYENRNSAEQRAQKACNGFWSHSVAEQEAKAKKEKAKEDEDSKKEKAQEENPESEVKNAKPVSFLQEKLSQAEALKQWQSQQEAEVKAHEAEMDADLPDPTDELTDSFSDPFDKKAIAAQFEHAEKPLTGKEMQESKDFQAKIEKKEAYKHETEKLVEEWAKGAAVAAEQIQSSHDAAHALFDAQMADRKKMRNYDLPTDDWITHSLR